MAPTLRYSKIMKNDLLGRRQFVVECLHSGEDCLSKTQMAEKIAQLYKVSPERVSIFGLKTVYGGSKTSGYCCVYNSEEEQRKFEPKYRLVRSGLVASPAKGKVSRTAIRAARNKLRKMTPADKRKTYLAKLAKGK